MATKHLERDLYQPRGRSSKTKLASSCGRHRCQEELEDEPEEDTDSELESLYISLEVEVRKLSRQACMGDIGIRKSRRTSQKRILTLSQRVHRKKGSPNHRMMKNQQTEKLGRRRVKVQN